ncbi:Ankyrin repeat protein,protein kinase family protein (fragment) [Hyella patelloides LEGE 07179]|uniref:non-specific serine/threonine protein kinase n=1 Tax=Hyella patelloides LEGE 07179 TaxID=945734 RepID=A0A563VPP6_9CYAN
MKFDSQLGKIINHKYRLIEILGEGGWGVTYLAEDLKSKQQVALKVLALKGLQDWKQIDLFEKEAQVLQSIEHPAIPSYIEYFTIDTADNRYCYLAQELAPGTSLADWVKDGWRATETEVKQIAQQLLEILVYLHSQKPPIIHRDIKPINIIRQADGQIFLVDFGAVKNTYYSTLTGSSTVVGTYGYIAPEQFRGQATTASDLYSLGATILFLLTHISPTELSTDGLYLQFRSRVNISKDFADWLEIIIEPEIEKRFKDAQEALAVLNGKQKNPLKVKSFNLKGVVISGSIVVFGLLMLLNSYKWGILSRIGIVPRNICDPKVMSKYLKQGGNPNAWRTTSGSLSRIIEFCKD